MKNAEYRRVLRSLILEAGLTALVIGLVFSFVLGITVQEGNDMYPAVRSGDVVLYCRLGKLLPTEAVVYEEHGELRTGRIAAGPGAEISCTGDERLKVDGNMMPPDNKQGIYSETYTAEGEKLPVILGEDEYFILNDDRLRTADSREFGEINKKNIRGRVITILRRRLI